MPNKTTKEEFIEKAKKIHGNKYDYSKVNYINTHEKVCIICPEHGEFWQTPHGHLAGNGCKKCASARTGEQKKISLNDFIKRAKLKHGDKYDYSKVEYTNCDTKVCIICPEHGEFWQRPMAHLRGDGCPKCGLKTSPEEINANKAIFITRAKEKYGDKYDYSNMNYINSITPIEIICPIHNSFMQTPHDHLYNNGCPKCSEEEKIKKQILKEENIEKRRLKNEQIREDKEKEFIKKASEIHNNKYDYSKVKYISSNKKVCIICPEHGEFWQDPNSHAHGHGCPICARIQNAENRSFNTEQFIENARKVHGDKYDYSKVNYINNSTKVCIICPKHGEFYQTPAMHYNEHQGCPLCGTLSSADETEIYNFIKNNCDHEIVLRSHDIVKRKEIDILDKTLKIGIEFDGLRWHSELFKKNKNYHLNKTLECNQTGYKLIHIFEDEFVYHKEIVLNKIEHLLQFSSKNKKKIMGRKCLVKEINYNTAETFLNKFHIQGFVRGTVHLGCYFNDLLVGVMSFTKEIKNSNKWELTRFATNFNYICSGIGGKLFKYFVKNYNPDEVKSFADRRWTINENDNLYTKIGFIFDSYVEPSYSYTDSNTSFRKRYHKFNFRKNILHKKYGLPLSMTEHEMAIHLGFYRIYDCGLIKYIWKNPEN